MRDFIDVTGKNQEDATAKALEQLGLDRDDVSVEVLEREKAGFLGIGKSPAKIRVYYGPEKEEPVPVKTEAPKAKPEAAKPAAKPELKEVSTASPAQERRPRPQAERKPKPRPAAAEPKEEKPVPSAPAQELGEQVDDEKAQAIKTFLSGLLKQMDSEAEIEVYLPEKGRYKVFLKGQGIGSLIGRRGETLDAIQQLTSYAVNRNGVRVRVQLDAENYREKREQSLQHLARKVAGKVVRYRRSVTLEPMNAYERHVIHTALQDYPGVTTHSTGTDPGRRVVVTYERDKH